MPRKFTKFPGKSISANEKTTKRPITAAESYGWVVNDWEAWDAYEFAREYFDDLDEQIIGCMSSEELAACLAFLFRMNDFREWEERDSEEEDEDEE